MTDQNKHHNYTLADIEKYLQGKLSSAEMHELEKAALQDPFLADAIEGFKETDLSTAHEHLEEIHQELSLGDAAKYTGIVKPIASKSWWKVAASIIVVVGAATTGWLLLNPTTNKKELASHTAVPANDTLQKKNNAEQQSLALIEKSDVDKPGITGNRQKIKKLPKTGNQNNPAEREPAADMIAERHVPAAKTHDRSFSTMQIPSKKTQPVSTQKDSANRQLSASVQSQYDATAMAKERSKAMELKPMAQMLSGRASGLQVREERPLLKDSSFAKYRSYPSRAPSDTLYFYSGKLLTADKTPVGGASLVLKNNTQKAFVSKPDGSFALGTLDSALEITVSSVGFETAKVKLVPGENNTITLQPSNQDLNDIVVTGYSRSAKKDITGSVKKQEPSIYPEGGWGAFKEYLLRELSTKAGDQKDKLYGGIEIQLSTDETGKPRKVSILNSFNNSLRNAIIDAIKKGPNWINTAEKEIKNARVTIQF
jgi:hypothetical protein